MILQYCEPIINLIDKLNQSLTTAKVVDNFMNGKFVIDKQETEKSFRCLTFAVTLGFPSLSPPIQEPNFIGVQVKGSGFPVCYWREKQKKQSSRENCASELENQETLRMHLINPPQKSIKWLQTFFRALLTRRK